MTQTPAVPARITLTTLPVADVAAATAFYQRLGFALSSASVAGDVSFFHTGGSILALWGRSDLAQDANVDAAELHRVALAINVSSPDEVDTALAAAQSAGATIPRGAQTTDWGGYNGYFADLDGHLWEVAHNPFWPLDERGMPTLP